MSSGGAEGIGVVGGEVKARVGGEMRISAFEGSGGLRNIDLGSRGRATGFWCGFS